MFENLVAQEAGKSLISDIKSARFPRAVLFSGAEASGKLTAALECARIFSCSGTAERWGSWQCGCPQCLQSKSLTSTGTVLMGPRDCSLEIAAAQKTFLDAVASSAQFLTAARYLYIRSIRKLTMRFNPILWQGDSDLGKIGSVMEEINEDLECLDFPRDLPSLDELRKITENLAKQTSRLEDDFLYSSIPISQVRNMEAWAHIKSEDGRKTVIIENADRMLEGVRNALLKILEEPPADCVFILLTSRRNAMMQTILSRVRTYTFRERAMESQADVISRVFHDSDACGKLTINDYLLTFLPVPPSQIKNTADDFCNAVASRRIIDCNALAKSSGNFSPRVELRLFLHYIAAHYSALRFSQAGSEAGAKVMALLRKCYENVVSYNQTAGAALETLFRDLSAINAQNGGILQ